MHDETQGDRGDGGKWFTRQSDPQVSTNEGKKDLEDATINPNGIQITTMCKMSRFRWFICCSLDDSLSIPVGRIFARLGIHKGWANLNNCLW